MIIMDYIYYTYGKTTSLSLYGNMLLWTHPIPTKNTTPTIQLQNAIRHPDISFQNLGTTDGHSYMVAWPNFDQFKRESMRCDCNSFLRVSNTPNQNPGGIYKVLLKKLQDYILS